MLTGVIDVSCDQDECQEVVSYDFRFSNLRLDESLRLDGWASVADPSDLLETHLCPKHRPRTGSVTAIPPRRS